MPSPRSREAGAALSPRFLRLVIGGVLGFATLVAVVFTLNGGSGTPLLIIGTFWGVMGIITAIFDAVDRVPEALVSVLTNVGLTRHADGFSQIEALVAQGHHAAAAESYRLRAARDSDRVEATVRRAWLLAGPLGEPATAVAELEALREGARLTPAEEVRVGLVWPTCWMTGRIRRVGRSASCAVWSISIQTLPMPGPSGFGWTICGAIILSTDGIGD